MMNFKLVLCWVATWCPYVCLWMSAYMCTERSSQTASVFAWITLFEPLNPSLTPLLLKGAGRISPLSLCKQQVCCWTVALQLFDTHSTDHWWFPCLLAVCLTCPVRQCVKVFVCGYQTNFKRNLSGRWRISFAG